MKQLTLSINTTNNLKTIVQLGKVRIVKKYKNPKDQELLTLINQIMKKAHSASLRPELRPRGSGQASTFKDIKEIKVNIGPGSFTGIRVGVSVANALAWSLGIKVNGKKQVIPVYN